MTLAQRYAQRELEKARADYLAAARRLARAERWAEAVEEQTYAARAERTARLTG